MGILLKKYYPSFSANTDKLMFNNEKVIWVAWESHRRTKEICNYFNIELYTFSSPLIRLFKHPLNLIKTFLLLNKKRPSILFVQNPSIILACFACILKHVYRYVLLVDAHNTAIIPDTPIQNALFFLYRFAHKNADITIVTNKFLAKHVLKNGGNSFVLPDRIPRPEGIKKVELKGKQNIFFICTFGYDEPFEEIFSVVEKLDPEIFVYVTGNYQKYSKEILNNFPDNLVFTGFMPDTIYWNYLYSCDLAIDLTTRENCLVCGAYEALAVGTPLILSDTKALRTFFYKGVVFAENMSGPIYNAICDGLSLKDKLKNEIIELKNELENNWEKDAKSFQNLICEINQKF